VIGGVDPQGRIVISTYPSRPKMRNADDNPLVSVLILSVDWEGLGVQVNCEAEVLHMPEAAEPRNRVWLGSRPYSTPFEEWTRRTRFAGALAGRGG
jgi:hypothetical protein